MVRLSTLAKNAGKEDLLAEMETSIYKFVLSCSRTVKSCLLRTDKIHV